MKKTFEIINGNVLYLFFNGTTYHCILQRYNGDHPCGCIEKYDIFSMGEVIRTLRFYRRIAS